MKYFLQLIIFLVLSKPYCLLAQSDSLERSSYTPGFLSELYLGQNLEKVYKNALQILQTEHTENNPQEIAQAQYHLGKVYTYQGNYAQALTLFLDYLKTNQEQKNIKGEAQALYEIGKVYLMLKDYPQALRNFKKSLALFQEINAYDYYLALRISMGNLYNQMGASSQALDYLLATLKMAQESNYTLPIAQAYQGISEVYIALKQNEQAIQYAQLALQIFSDIPEPLGRIRVKKNLGIIYTSTQAYAQAIELLQQALNEANSIQALPEILTIYQALARAYQNKGDFSKALKVHQKFISTQDSIWNKQSQQKIIDLKTQYTLQEKEEEIKLLREKLMKQPNLTPPSNIFNYFLAISFFLLLGFVLFLFYGNVEKRKNNHALLQKYNENTRQKAAITAQKDELLALNQEKNEMIRTVAHDLQAPVNRIYGLADLINLEREALSPDQKRYLDLISRVAHDSRTLIQNWLDIRAIEEKRMRMTLEEVNLEELMASLLVSYNQYARKKGIAIHYHNTLKNHIFISDQGFLNRILDNLVSNAIKFSPLHKNIYIYLEDNQEHLIISIKDEGIGISEHEREKLFGKFQKLSARPTAGESSTGLGLSIVKTLVMKLQGEISVKSQIGEGSTFIIQLPKMLKTKN